MAAEGEHSRAVEGAVDLTPPTDLSLLTEYGVVCPTLLGGATAAAWLVSESKDTATDNPSREKTAEVRVGRSGAMRMLRTYTVVVAAV